MLTKTVERYNHDWDRHLPYVLYAYRVSVQESIRESPFFLLYGRDPTLPMLEALSRERSPYMVDLNDYKTELMTELNSAWTAVQECIAVTQKCQKSSYDRTAQEPKLEVGQQVMVHMPSEIQGKTWKFIRPFHGPYRILSLIPTNTEVRLVDDPKSASIFVSLDRVRKCYDELPDLSWQGHTLSTPYTGPMTRSRSTLSYLRKFSHIYLMTMLYVNFDPECMK